MKRMGGWADGRIQPTRSSAHPLIRSSASGAENMALDVALLRTAQLGQAGLRLYRWDPPCLSFGRNEPALTRYDRARIEQLGLDTVRRPTGGRAVWHHEEVTYAVAAPVAMFGSLAESYLAIHQVIAQALTTLGVRCTLATVPRSPFPVPSAGACFASPAGGEVVVGGRKLVGSAQIREGNAFLQHGSILLGDGQDVVTRVTRGAAAPPAATSLSALLGTPVAFPDVADAITREARNSLGLTEVWEDVDPDPELVSHFGDPAWTWRR